MFGNINFNCKKITILYVKKKTGRLNLPSEDGVLFLEFAEAALGLAALYCRCS